MQWIYPSIFSKRNKTKGILQYSLDDHLVWWSVLGEDCNNW